MKSIFSQINQMFSRQVLRWVIFCVVVVVFPQYANAWGGHYSVPIGIHRDASGCGTVYLRCTGGGDERKEDFLEITNKPAPAEFEAEPQQSKRKKRGPQAARAQTQPKG